jgi:hypothetical protein
MWLVIVIGACLAGWAVFIHSLGGLVASGGEMVGEYERLLHDARGSEEADEAESD